MRCFRVKSRAYGRIALKGKIGTTPRNSRVWSSRRLEFADFVQAVGELVWMIEKQMANGSTGSSVLSRLAQPVADTTGICGAFEIVPVLDEPPDAAEPDPGNAAAAAALEYAAFVVTGRPDAVDFIVETGVDGTIGGSLTGTHVQPHLSRARYDAHVGLPCDASAADDTFRLRLLERLLHHARRDAIHGVCEELVVIASAG